MILYFQFNLNYDKEWDERLNDVLDENIDEILTYTIVIGNYEIWTSNYIYGYGNLYRLEDKSMNECRYPSIKTRLRLHKKIKKHNRDEYTRRFKNAK